MDPMLSKALRDFMSGPLNQLIVNLAGKDGAQWEAELSRFTRREPCWIGKPTKISTMAPSRIFEFLWSSEIAAASERFSALDVFRDRKGNTPMLKFTPNVIFEELFLLDGGLIEEPALQKNIYCHRLLTSVSDRLIIDRFGGVQKLRTSLQLVYDLMVRQQYEEPGVLKTDGRVNLFYVADALGAIRVVRIYRKDDQWVLHGEDFEPSGGRTPGTYIYSHYPLEL